MDTKLKNNRNKRILYTAIVILALSVINFCFFHLIYASAEKEVEGTEQYYSDINEDTSENLYSIADFLVILYDQYVKLFIF